MVQQNRASESGTMLILGAHSTVESTTPQERERRVFFNGSIKDYIKWQNDNGGLPSVIINSLRIASSSTLTALGGALYGLLRVVPAWSPTDSDFTV